MGVVGLAVGLGTAAVAAGGVRVCQVAQWVHKILRLHKNMWKTQRCFPRNLLLHIGGPRPLESIQLSLNVCHLITIGLRAQRRQHGHRPWKSV
jgi:hypothetical protein